MRFSDSLEANAFRSAGGEYAWLEADALAAVDQITSSGLPLLGGEVWLVNGSTINALPWSDGRPSLLGWTCERGANEPLELFVQRSREESVSAIQRLAGVPIDRDPEGGEVRFNLTWAEPHFD